MKNIICAIGIAAASLLNGCGQGKDNAGGDPATSASGALNVVQDCVADAKACAAAAKSVADGQACGDELRACLGPLVADAGGFTLPPLPPFPAIDAGIGLPPFPTIDAALPPVPDPGKTQAAVKACVTTLNGCLSSATDPMTCAEQARACLTQAI